MGWIKGIFPQQGPAWGSGLRVRMGSVRAEGSALPLLSHQFLLFLGNLFSRRRGDWVPARFSGNPGALWVGRDPKAHPNPPVPRAGTIPPLPRLGFGGAGGSRSLGRDPGGHLRGSGAAGAGAEPGAAPAVPPGPFPALLSRFSVAL